MRLSTHLSKYCGLISATVLLFSGCQSMSEKIIDKNAGLNGGFEVSQNGLPVNWLVYSTRTVPNADFKIILDRQTFKEGSQSLRFEVKQCVATGGWHSPGFTNEFSEIGKFMGQARYKLSFWIKNDGAKYNVSAGAVTSMKGDMKTLVENDQSDKWKMFEYKLEVPAEHWLRLQLNILKPGTFWIDDIKIEKI